MPALCERLPVEHAVRPFLAYASVHVLPNSKLLARRMRGTEGDTRPCEPKGRAHSSNLEVMLALSDAVLRYWVIRDTLSLVGPV